jgi:hypothetical protein
VDGRQGRAHVGVALVGADHHAAGLGDGEVHAGEPCPRLQEPAAKVVAGCLGQVGRVAGAAIGPQLLVEQLADLLLLEVDGRHDDVTGRLAAELDDALAEIGVGHLDAARLEVRIQVALLGQHRLGLDQPGHAALGQDAVDDGVVLGGVAGEPDLGAARPRVLLELLQVIGQPRQGGLLDARGRLAQELPVRHLRHRQVSLLPDPPHRLVVPLRARSVGDEAGGRLGMTAHASASLAARISATCMTRSGRRARRMSPSRCIRQDMSVPAMISAPAPS